MREILIDKTFRKLKLQFKKNFFEKALDAFPTIILTGLFPPFIISSTYFSINGDISKDYLILSVVMSLFFSWFIIGWLNRGKIKRVEKIGKTEAIKLIETEINEGNVRDVLNRLNENYIGLRYGGLNIGAFSRDVYFIFKEDTVYITSIAVGRGDDASPFHYFMNKSKTNGLIKELNSTQHAV